MGCRERVGIWEIGSLEGGNGLLLGETTAGMDSAGSS